MEFSGQYLTYNEYRALGGNLDLTPFNILEFEARKVINENTQNRLINLEEQIQDVKLCVFKLINQKVKDNERKGISSESVGSYSVNYDTVSTEEEKKSMNDIVYYILIDCRLEDGTPYLYRGVRQ